MTIPTSTALRLCLLIALGALLNPAVACSRDAESTDPGASSQEPAAAAQEPSGGAEAQPADTASFPEVVAKVNETEIKKTELLQRAEAVQARMGGAASTLDFYHRVLEQLVGAELLYQASEDRGLVPADTEVDTQMEAIRSRFPDPAKFEQALASEGMSPEELRQNLKEDLGIQKLIETEIVEKVTVTDEQMRSFYEENKEQMKQPEQVRVSHILVRAEAEAGDEQKAAARQKAEKLRERAVAGEDFAELARENSDDPGSKTQGGDLSWVGRGSTVPPFEQAAFGLKEGEVSPVVETQFGYHVIKLFERRAESTMPYESVKDRIAEFLKQQGVQEKIEAEIQTLKAKADVKIFI